MPAWSTASGVLCHKLLQLVGECVITGPFMVCSNQVINDQYYIYGIGAAEYKVIKL